ncbi:MAG TPA: tetratricopeptide repeat protein [Bryobacteraceae bacterium]|nr:tetratricopeptide repeat protein [Bryobacteraceae bacterium]
MWWQAALLALLLWQQKPDPIADGMKALEEQRWDAAAEIFGRAAAADPREYTHHFHLGLALSMLNRDAEAIAEYQKVLELKPGLYQAELNLGILLVRQKRTADALPHLLSAVRAKSKELRPNLYLGEALLATGDAVKAEAAFRTAVDVDPKSASAAAGLARALSAQKRESEALAQWERAAELDPGYRDAAAAEREQIGERLLESGKAEEAIAYLEAAVKQSPTAANRYALATAYIMTKNLDRATPLLEQALQSEPGNIELRMMYGRALREQRRFAAAAQEFARVAQAKPDSAEAWSDLAGMLILIEDYAQALAALDKVRALGAEKAPHHYFRAIVLDKHRQYKPALESYQRFLAMSGGRNPDEEFKARQRVRILEKELSKR